MRDKRLVAETQSLAFAFMVESWQIPLLASEGTGAPVRKNRPPIICPAGIEPPGLRSVLTPFSPICPPEEANVA